MRCMRVGHVRLAPLGLVLAVSGGRYRDSQASGGHGGTGRAPGQAFAERRGTRGGRLLALESRHMFVPVAWLGMGVCAWAAG